MPSCSTRTRTYAVTLKVQWAPAKHAAAGMPAYRTRDVHLDNRSARFFFGNPRPSVEARRIADRSFNGPYPLRPSEKSVGPPVSTGKLNRDFRRAALWNLPPPVSWLKPKGFSNFTIPYNAYCFTIQLPPSEFVVMGSLSIVVCMCGCGRRARDPVSVDSTEKTRAGNWLYSRGAGL